jgi:pimeloyl-ACP methyl ester carboxylesterase
VRTVWARIAATTCLLGLAACASSPTAPESLHLPVKLNGLGSPAVIFEAGAGEKLDTWDLVQPEVSKLARTFAYTRHGYAGAPALSHRDALTIVEELRAQLREHQLPPPYLLVGHSIGGLYMQVYAKTYPQEVMGVVLVDTSHPDQIERMKTERHGNYLLARTMMVTLGYANTAGAEMRGFAESQRQWHAAGPWPDVPMILLSAQRDTGLNGHEFTAFFQNLQRELVASWPGAELRNVDSDHFVQRNRPEEVVKAIRDVLARAKPSRPVS